MVQLGGFLGRCLWPSLKADFPSVKNLSQPLAKSVLIALGLTVAEAGADAGMHRKYARIRKSNINFKLKKLWYHENN